MCVKTLKIAICDDKMIFHEHLKDQLQCYSSKRNVIFVYTDFISGSELLTSKIKFDVIFMDYQMDGINGIETSRKLRDKKIDTPIVFLTSFQHAVFDAFEVNAFRFLLKPIETDKLFAAMDGLLADTADDKYIIIRIDEDYRRIHIDDIIYAEAFNKHCYIRLTQSVILYKKTLAEFEAMLPEDRFFRSHRTFLVGFRHVVSHNVTEVFFDNKERALISRTKHSAFRKAFLDYVKRYQFTDR